MMILTFCTTAGERPMQNGLCERVFVVTEMMLTKLEDEQNAATSETLLCKIVFRCGMALLVTSLERTLIFL